MVGVEASVISDATPKADRQGRIIAPPFSGRVSLGSMRSTQT